MRFDRKKAAQYYVVAWVKDWSLKTYLDAIGNGERIDFSEANTLYPWLPSEPFLFARGRVRRWTREAMREINDALWDTDENEKKLLLADRIERWKADGNIRFSKREEINEGRRSQKSYVNSAIEFELSQNLNERAGGHHWNVCK